MARNSTTRPKGSGTPAGGYVHKPPRTPRPDYTAETQPPAEHKALGHMNAAEYRAELETRRAKALKVLDNALLMGETATDAAGVSAGMRAVDHITDRLDGKATQPLSGGDGGPLTVVLRRFVEDVPGE